MITWLGEMMDIPWDHDGPLLVRACNQRPRAPAGSNPLRPSLCTILSQRSGQTIHHRLPWKWIKSDWMFVYNDVWWDLLENDVISGKGRGGFGRRKSASWRLFEFPLCACFYQLCGLPRSFLSFSLFFGSFQFVERPRASIIGQGFIDPYEIEASNNHSPFIILAIYCTIDGISISFILKRPISFSSIWHLTRHWSDSSLVVTRARFASVLHANALFHSNQDWCWINQNGAIFLIFFLFHNFRFV